MTTAALNLARKWRSKTFDHIIGQELPVKILRNSLFKGAFFPVYLFAGQRGCGKTSTARVFATALNCEHLSAFQKDPRSVSMPCLACDSCSAMIAGRHADFFEIDAASHTGVDNVRQILDASTLMPLMGKKKIYLIDEAHMLSKASCNAFLKILEEPPPSVLFILATTDPQKILETVRSRCLQLYFKPVDTDVLVAHLRSICEQEGIRYAADGLRTIAHESHGSVRDALNILEQVRFASSAVSGASVQQVLGHCDSASLVHVLMLTFCGTARELLVYLEEQQLAQFSHDHLWNSLVTLLRTVIWLKHGVTIDDSRNGASLKNIASSCSMSELVDALRLFYYNESIALRVGSKYRLLEMVLLQIAQKRNRDSESGNDSSIVSTQTSMDPAHDVDSIKGLADEHTVRWHSFLSGIERLNDPLMISVFKQATFLGYSNAKKLVRIGFSTKLLFFNDWIDDSRAVWQEHIHAVFGAGVDLAVEFTESIVYKEAVLKQTTAAVATQTNPPNTQTSHQKVPLRVRNQGGGISWEAAFALKKIGTLDVASDKNKWKLANTILEHFPGTIYEIEKRST